MIVSSTSAGLSPSCGPEALPRAVHKPSARSDSRGAALDEGYEVLLGVAEEGHPLLASDRPEVTGVVAVDVVGLGDELDAGREQ